jgi:AraC-like DNA-binding protein
MEVMVTTTEILPCPALQPYVRCYAVREFNTSGADFIKPLPAYHEFSIAFTLGGSISTSKTVYGDAISGSQHIIGLQTAHKGSVIYSGNVKLLNIIFTPNGFYKLFNLPLNLLTNRVYKVSDIIVKGMTTFNERINEAKNLTDMKNVADELLLSNLLRSKTSDVCNSITSTSSIIFQNKGNVNVKNLACEANMSLRSFEKKFAEQVGIAPKIYARLNRFNHALFLRMINSSRSWTDISHQCGYYDQMHFIKEFKEFAGDSPGNFYKISPLPFENYKKH